MDDMDRAQAREELDRLSALEAQRMRCLHANAPRDARLDGLCADCGEPIEAARMAALRNCASRCIDCARTFEKSHHHFGHAG